MKRLLLPLVAAIALPIAVDAIDKDNEFISERVILTSFEPEIFTEIPWYKRNLATG